MDAQGLQGENKDSITKPNGAKEKLIPSASLSDLENIAKFTKA